MDAFTWNPRDRLRAKCPVCGKKVALGLYGEVIPWHLYPNSRKPCPGEGEEVRTKTGKEEVDG